MIHDTSTLTACMICTYVGIDTQVYKPICPACGTIQMNMSAHVIQQLRGAWESSGRAWWSTSQEKPEWWPSDTTPSLLNSRDRDLIQTALVNYIHESERTRSRMTATGGEALVSRRIAYMQDLVVRLRKEVSRDR